MPEGRNEIPLGLVGGEDTEHDNVLIAGQNPANTQTSLQTFYTTESDPPRDFATLRVCQYIVLADTLVHQANLLLETQGRCC